MIGVTIGRMTVAIEKASQRWINQMIAEANRRGVPICVQVSIQTPQAQLFLATVGCPQGGGDDRAPNATEARIIAAWRRRGLSKPVFDPGELRAFLDDVARVIEPVAVGPQSVKRKSARPV